MAAFLDGVFPASIQDKIKQSKVLVVGAGGIGCEVLKNLVLSGFHDIEIIDLDTIDLSNLNRQFLFHREHVGKSKAMVARESALAFNPDAKIVAYHDSVLNTDYGVSFFQKFNVVLNALDNRQARNHVNRMCLHADVPLIESGTAGYNGQVELIKKGLTQCYECMPKERQKTFPGCTIRNTPSEPIHCIVWAKHLFNQLFGETVDEEDISPDIADPKAQDSIQDFDFNIVTYSEKDIANGTAAGKVDGGDEKKKEDEKYNIERINTRQWAKDNEYNPEKLFNKFFLDDINYLISMTNLWKERKAPIPLEWKNLLEENGDGDAPAKAIRDYHKVWSVVESAKIFAKCLNELSTSFLKLDESDSLVWDKDDKPAMAFVAACANLRSHIFQIERKSLFEMKSMAGNIIPAIATTNAITAGISVMRAFNVLRGELDKCTTVYTRLRLNPRKRFIVPEKCIEPANKSCTVCSVDPAIKLRIDTKRMRVKDFRDEVLIKTINMVKPDVLNSNRGEIVLSSEDGETECNEEKFLHDMSVVDGVLLKCDDFLQNYDLSIIIEHFDAGHDEPLFKVLARDDQLKPKEIEEQLKIAALLDELPSSSKRIRFTNDDDDLMIVDEPEIETYYNKKVVTTDVSPNKKEPTIPVKTSAVKRKQDDSNNEVLTVYDSDDDDDDEDSNGAVKPKRSRQQEAI